MRSDSGIIYHEPPKPLWVPRTCATRPTGLAVRFKTEICDVDAQGKIVRAVVTNDQRNMITDWGMDALATLRQDQVVNYLHLSDTLGPAKRVLTGGTTVTVTVTSATSIAIAASANFFLVGDVGKTFSITDFGGAGKTQELLITGFTDAQNITCSTRHGAWLPGFVAGAGPFANAAVHPTNTNTLANQFTKFNTYDGSAVNFAAELNDSGNSRFIHQRIFLSAAVAGSAWTVNQVGWSDGNGANNVFGWANLAAPDVVAVGKKYRVTLQFYSAYTPIDIASQSINWGATIGTYDLAIRSEIFPTDTTTASNVVANFLRPVRVNGNFGGKWWTSAFTLQTIRFQGDVGYTVSAHGSAAGVDTVEQADAAYVNGSHMKTRSVRWSDNIAITNATGLGIAPLTGSNTLCVVALKPSSGTISKPSGYWAQLDFGLYWTRTLVN